MGASAYPTDRILGGAGPGRSSPRSMGFPVATPGALARLSRSRQGLPSEPASRSNDFRGRWWTSSTRRPAARLSFTRGARVGCRVHPDACIQVCFGARQAGRLPTFELAKETSRGFSPSRWRHWRGFREIRSFLQEFLRRMARVAGQTLNTR
jgi:hypothetical protein